MSLVADMFRFTAVALVSLLQFGQGEYFEKYLTLPAFVTKSDTRVNIDTIFWPNGIVPYVLDAKLNKADKQKVINVLSFYNNFTCIEFIPKTNKHVEHVKFVKTQFKCGTHVGYKANDTEPVVVSLSQESLREVAYIHHLVLHVLGMFHEHSRFDRDDYVKILWSNVLATHGTFFLRIPEHFAQTFGFRYDYGSIMHYPNDAYVRPGQNVTILSKKDPSRKFGRAMWPSLLDLKRIRQMYKCRDHA